VDTPHFWIGVLPTALSRFLIVTTLFINKSLRKCRIDVAETGPEQWKRIP